MKRRELVPLLGSAVAWPRATRAQQPTAKTLGLEVSVTLLATTHEVIE
ncbi:MAG TPA: hypothetical protein VH678_16935 [Xanthobacteraceae bacterium]|jgi:hypothetical protein